MPNLTPLKMHCPVPEYFKDKLVKIQLNGQLQPILPLYRIDGYDINAKFLGDSGKMVLDNRLLKVYRFLTGEVFCVCVDNTGPVTLTSCAICRTKGDIIQFFGNRPLAKKLYQSLGVLSGHGGTFVLNGFEEPVPYSFWFDDN